VIEEKRFEISLIVSFFIHSFVLFRLPSFQGFDLPKVITSIEVTYHKLEREIEKKTEEKTSSKSFLKSPPPFIDKGISDIKRPKIQKEPISIDKLVFEKKITLPEIPSPNMTSSAYLSYYQRVREKIRLCAYRNYTHPEEGEICLSFCISSDGNLKKINLQEERSAQSEYLKKIALKSIQDASPFPVFPKDLEFPELFFNVIISFEAE